MADNGTRTVRVILIPADASAAPRAIQVAAHALDLLLGGCAGLTSLPGTCAQVYSNDRGRDLGLPPNPRATRLVTRFIPGFARNDMILGPAVLVGIADDGLEGDVPRDVEAMVFESS